MEKYFESFKSQKLQEEMLSSQDIFKGKILDVKMDTVRLPNGKTATRELIRHIGAVCIVAVTEDDEVIVEHQYRYPFDEVVVEIPAGKLDSKDEDPADAAERELMAVSYTHLAVYKRQGMKIADFDLIEANEAFASQSIAVGQSLGFDLTKLNVNGGAIALGHPVGASGCRILVTLLYAMKHHGAKTGLATLCIGGGMGCATIVKMEDRKSVV